MFDYDLKTNFYSGIEYTQYYNNVVSKCIKYYQNNKNIEPGMSKYNKEALIVLNSYLLKYNYLKVKCVLIIDMLTKNKDTGKFIDDQDNIALARMIKNIKDSVNKTYRYIYLIKAKIVKKTLINNKILKLIQIVAKSWEDRIIKVNNLLNSDYIKYTDIVLYQNHLGKDILEEIEQFGIECAYTTITKSNNEVKYKETEEYTKYKEKINNYLKTVTDKNIEKEQMKEEFKAYKEIAYKKEQQDKEERLEKERLKIKAICKDRLYVEIQSILNSNDAYYINIRNKLFKKYCNICKRLGVLDMDSAYLVLKIDTKGINKNIITYAKDHEGKSFTSDIEKVVFLDEYEIDKIQEIETKYGAIGVLNIKHLKGFNSINTYTTNYLVI